MQGMQSTKVFDDAHGIVREVQGVKFRTTRQVLYFFDHVILQVT